MIKDLLLNESRTITEQPIKIPFEFPNTDSLPDGKTPGDCIVIRPLTVRTWFMLRPLLMQIDKEDMDIIIAAKGELTSDFQAIMNKYGSLLIDIVCIGIHNKTTTPPVWFRGVLMDNSTWEDIQILLNAVLFRIGFNPFCKSITTLANVSPVTETEIIAAQRPEEHTSALQSRDPTSYAVFCLK